MQLRLENNEYSQNIHDQVGFEPQSNCKYLNRKEDNQFHNLEDLKRAHALLNQTNFQWASLIAKSATIQILQRLHGPNLSSQFQFDLNKAKQVLDNIQQSIHPERDCAKLIRIQYYLKRFRKSRQSQCQCHQDVLVVDDEEIARQGVIQKLKKEFAPPLRFIEAKDGLEALRIIAEKTPCNDCCPRFLCITSDQDMPGMDGLRMQRLLKQHALAMPLMFFVVSATDDQSRNQIQDLGFAQNVFPKPLSKENIIQMKKILF